MWRFAAAAGRPAGSIRRPRTARRPRSTSGWSEHATPELARQTTRRRGTLGLELRWLGTQADRLEDPATLKAVSRAVDHARQLVHDLQRELERSAPQREADGER